MYLFLFKQAVQRFVEKNELSYGLSYGLSYSCPIVVLWSFCKQVALLTVAGLAASSLQG